jgi:hypothetical protein
MFFMRAEVAERKARINGSVSSSSTDQHGIGLDIFTALVQANEDEDAKFKLDDQELVRLLISLILPISY